MTLVFGTWVTGFEYYLAEILFLYLAHSLPVCLAVSLHLLFSFRTLYTSLGTADVKANLALNLRGNKIARKEHQ